MANKKGVIGSGNTVFTEIGIFPQGRCQKDPATGLIIPPSDETIVLAAPAAIGDTTLDLTGNPLSDTATSTGIGKGTPIIFNRDTVNNVYAIVDADALPGATSLTIKPLQRALAAADTATHLGLERILGGETADESNDAETAEVTIFEEESGFKFNRVTTQMASISWGGLFLEEDPAYIRLREFQRFQSNNASGEFYVRITNPTPNVLGGIASASRIQGTTTVSNLSVTRPTTDFLKISFELMFQGSPEVIDWVHAAV